MVRHSDTLCAISAGYYVVAETTQQYQIKAETQVYTDKTIHHSVNALTTRNYFSSRPVWSIH